MSESQVGEEFIPTFEFIEQKVSDYKKLLDSGLVPLFDEENVVRKTELTIKRTRK